MKNMKPILFSTPMVQAILSGNKTMTRRVIKPQPSQNWMDNVFSLCPSGNMYRSNGEQMFWLSDNGQRNNKDSEIYCPYGKPGDILWVRETFAWMEGWLGSEYVVHKADGFKKNKKGTWEMEVENKFHDVEEVTKWTPSIFMPKEACRLFLKVTNVRVERLNEISQEDAKSEGIDNPCPHRPASTECTKHKDNSLMRDCYVCAFRVLWQSINKNWESNPWVWVIEFEQCEKPEE